MKQLHFCGGLPRTGSTVLMNILQQNPDVFTTSTDPFPEILKDQILIKSRYRESFQAMSCKQADDAVYGMALGATRGWYEGLTSKPVAISKSRTWSELHHLFPNSKIIVTIRDLRDIIESFERVNSKIKALHTVGKDTLYAAMSENQKYHYHFDTHNALSGALFTELTKYMEIYKQDPNRIKFIRYEDMLKNPEYMLERIYQFLELQPYQHDLNNIEQSEMFEHDNAYFMEKTDHETKPRMIPWREPKRVLSDNFHKRVVENHRWFYDGFYPDAI